MAAATARAPSQPADDAPHLLLVDDDRRIRDLLSRFLAGEGYRVTTAMSAGDARAKLLGLHFDLLILDVMMPGETGFDLARFIRISSSVPIIMLTARHEAEARIEGLQIGADDYVAKPFEPRELVLRIGNILKRSAPPPVEALEQIAFGPYVFHLDRGELRQGEEIIHLTDREREMLRILAVAPGETVPRAALTGGGTVNERAVDVQINRLRRKIERDPANPLFLQADRAGTAGTGGRFPSPGRHAFTGAKAVLLAARPVPLGADQPPDQPSVLGRHRRQFQSGRDPHPARRFRDAGVRAAQQGLRLQF